MTENEFIEELTKLNIKLTDYQQEQLRQYCNYLLTYNKHTNLTAIKEESQVYLKHFYDSLTIVKCLQIDNQQDITILDIGTGAGFPGLVLKIVFPKIKLTLLDSNHKKTDFLKSCCANLKIKDVTIINERAENYISNHRENFDYVTSRAVATLRILCELSIPALKVGGYFIAMKGEIQPEINDSEATISALNSKIEKIIEFSLPKETGKRAIIKIKKKAKQILNIHVPMIK